GLSSGSNVIESPDGNIVVSGGSQGLQITKLDLSGNVLWEKTYQQENSGNGAIPIVADASSYTVIAKPDCCTPANFIINVDSTNGNIVWQHTYNQIRGPQAALAPNSDGGYFVAGGATNGMILYRVDSIGQIAGGSTNGMI